MKPGQGDCLLWGAALGDPPEVIKLGAFGDREIVEAVASSDGVWDNNVYWYMFLGRSGGFSGAGDVVADPGDQGYFDCAGRLSWHLNGDGGYRAGCYMNLDTSKVWKKLVFFGPKGIFCTPSLCPHGKIMRVEDLPPYCKGVRCLEDECCMPARSCTVDICTGGYLLKKEDVRPEFCVGTFCLATECCEPAPLCTVAVCGIGYFLKPSDALPPRGQPVSGCADYTCTRSECCNESPRCPDNICPPDMRLTTVNPNPYCTSYTCSISDCCSPAGECDVSLCPIDHVLDPYHPMYCNRTTCAIKECCYPLPPNVTVTGLRFVDEDLNSAVMGGTITWEPTEPSIPNVTHYTIHLVYKRNAVRVGNATWGTNEFRLPLGTPAASKVRVFTRNIGGEQAKPAEFEIFDSRMLPTKLVFNDYDLDAGEVGGAISWNDPIQGWLDAEAKGASLAPPRAATTPTMAVVAEACRHNAALRVEGGSGTGMGEDEGEPPAMYINDEFLNLTQAPGVVLAELTTDMSRVIVSAHFDTATNATEGAMLDVFLADVRDNNVLLLAMWGNALEFLPLRVKDRLRSFGATRLDEVGHYDSYALIVVRKGDLRVREVLAKADAGYARAVAEIFCPIRAYQVQFQNGPQSGTVGEANVGTTTIAFPMDTNLSGAMYLGLFVRTRLASQFAASARCEDQDGLVRYVELVPDDPTDSQSLAGFIKWVPPADMSMVLGYRVYFATSPDGKERFLQGGTVPAGTNQLRVPSGTARSNITHILVYSVSRAGEQSRPATISIYGVLGAVGLAASAAVVGAVAATQVVRVAAALSDKLNMQSLERVATKLDTAKDYPVPIIDTFCNSTLTVVVAPKGCIEATQWRSYISPLFHFVHHHDPIIRLKWKQGEEKHCETVHRVETCDNLWDNDKYVLQKISNREIEFYDENGQAHRLFRKTPFYWVLVERGYFNRNHFRMYAPMFVLIGIAALLFISGDRNLGGIILGLVGASVLVMIVARRMNIVNEVMNFIRTLPPERIRDRFWTGVQLFAGILPCAPAFLAQTTVGYLAGCVAILGAVMCSFKAYGLAAMVEGLGGAGIACFSMYQKYILGNSGAQHQAAASVYTAQFMAAVLIAVKAIDSFMENQEMLQKNARVPQDFLMKVAQPTEAATSVGLSNAIALEAFARGTVSKRLLVRLCKALRIAAHGLVDRGRLALAMMAEEVHGDGARWPRSSERLGFAVGRAIDAATADFYLGELMQARSNSARLVIETKIHTRFEELEDALKQLLSGPLASKAVMKYKACAKDLRQAVEELTADVRKLEECVGMSDSSGLRASVEIVGCCAATICTVANYLKTELSTDSNEGTTVVDVQILISKVSQVRTYADRAHRALRTMVLPPPAPPPKLLSRMASGMRFSSFIPGRMSLFDGGGMGYKMSAKNSAASLPESEPCPDEQSEPDEKVLEAAHNEALEASSQLQTRLAATSEALQWLGSPPSESGLKNVSEMLGQIVETCEMLLAFKVVVDERAPEADAVNGQLRDEAEVDVRNRLIAKVDAAHIAEASEALCMTRSAVALVSVVADELKAACERVETVVEAMAESRKLGYRTMHLVTQAKDFITGMTAGQVAKVQNEAVQLMLGAPLKALVYLQEGELEPVRSEFVSLQVHLKKLSAANVESPPPSPKGKGSRGMLSPPASPSTGSRGTKYTLRVHPEPEGALDPVHEMVSEMNDAFEPPMAIRVSPPPPSRK